MSDLRYVRFSKDFISQLVTTGAEWPARAVVVEEGLSPKDRLVSATVTGNGDLVLSFQPEDTPRPEDSYGYVIYRTLPLEKASA